MPLTDTAIRTAKPTDKPYKLSDEKGLFLLIQPNGAKYWRLKYRYGGKEKMLSFGVYPDIGLKDARTKRDEARNLLTKDVDPGEHKKATKAAKVERSANSFEVICRECAYSGEAGQRFHAKLDTHSRASWTVGA